LLFDCEPLLLGARAVLILPFELELELLDDIELFGAVADCAEVGPDVAGGVELEEDDD
jgi:hypothetical protein